MAHAHGTERWHVPLGIPRGIACRGLPALAPPPACGTLLAADSDEARTKPEKNRVPTL